MQLIARQGYSKTTLAQIGARSGYSAGLVSHRFGSKEGLLWTLVERIAGRFWEDQIVPAVGDRSGIGALCAMLDAYLHELTVREERMRALYVLMGEALGPVPELRPVFADLNRHFRSGPEKWILSGIEAGEIRSDVNAMAEAATFVGSLRGVALQWLAEPGCLDLDAARESLKASLRRRLAA